MQKHLIGAVVLLVCACMPFLAHAAAQFPDNKRLLPLPQGVHANISQNVNYTVPARSDTIVVPSEAPTPAQESPVSAQAAPAQSVPHLPLLIIALAAILALAILFFVWRMLQE